MKRRRAIQCALLLVAQSRFAFTEPLDETEKSNKEETVATESKKSYSTVSVPIKISAEDKSSLPSGANIEWQGVGNTCTTEIEKKNLPSDGETLLNLPVCKVRLVIFITGFDTKTITLKIVKDKDKYKDPMHIIVKHTGSPEIAK